MILKRIISEKYLIDNIPVITFFEENRKNLPLIFLAHGFESKKEIHTDIAWNLAYRGFFTVIIDAEKHGERKDPNFCSMSYEKKIGKLLEIVHSTTKDIKFLIEHFSKQKNIDNTKIGISGNSMGGILSCYAGSILDEISAIVCAIGSPSWIDLGKYLIHTDKSFKNILNYNEQFLLDNDPEKNLLRFKNKNIFLLSGKYDEVIPSVFSKNFYKKILEENILDETKIKFSEYPVNHQVSPTMKEDIYSWLSDFFYS